MGLRAVWKILVELTTEFRRRGMTIPARVMNSIRSTKTLIKIFEMNSDRKDLRKKIEKHLLEVQSYLISECQKKFGKACGEDWLWKLNRAESEPHDREKKRIKFVSGIPKDKKWIRVETSSELPAEKMKALTSKLNLSYETQNNNHLIVFGEEKNIKNFLKKITKKFKPKK